MTTKTAKNDGFLMVFWSFWVLGPILAHQTAKFKLSGQFCFSRHPWGPWERQSSGVICIWKIFQLFCEWWRHLVKKNVSFKLEPDVTFIILNDKKVTLSICIATIAWFSKRSTVWSHVFETFQWKSGQCDQAHCKHYRH